MRGFAARFRAPQAFLGDPEVRNFEPISRARRAQVRNVECLLTTFNCQRSRGRTQRDLTPINEPKQRTVLAGLQKGKAVPAHCLESRYAAYPRKMILRFARTLQEFHHFCVAVMRPRSGSMRLATPSSPGVRGVPRSPGSGIRRLRRNERRRVGHAAGGTTIFCQARNVLDLHGLGQSSHRDRYYATSRAEWGGGTVVDCEPVPWMRPGDRSCRVSAWRVRMLTSASSPVRRPAA